MIKHVLYTTDFHVMLSCTLSITMYVYVNATLDCHDSDLSRKTTWLLYFGVYASIHHESLSIIIASGPASRSGVSGKTGHVLPMIPYHRKPPD